MAVRTTPLPYALVMSLFFLAAVNFPFARALLASMGGFGLANVGDTFIVFSAVYAALFLVFFLTTWKGLTKPFGYVVLLTSAPAACAVLTVNTELSPRILLAGTELPELRALLSPVWIVIFFLLGVLPCALLRRVEIEYPPLRRVVAHKALAIAAAVVAGAGLYFPNQLFFNSFADNASNYRLKRMVVPFNSMGALAELLGDALEPLRRARVTREEAPGSPARVDVDARRGSLLAASGKRTVVVFVLGESARARSFSLNGYARETNPRLRRQEVVSFTRFYSCATATAQALPCLLSSVGERGFRRADQADNLLNVVQRAGFQVTWYENGMGTQAVTRGITEVTLGTFYRADRDHTLLAHLPTRAELVGTGKDHLIVLHERGSHGPDYSQRYTAEFRRFTPDCDSSVLRSCSHQAVVNAYDNTILYTDRNLDDAIEYLKRLEPEFNTALLYVSDHGESTGEDGWYMHGLPKPIAPDDQTHIPFVAWFSPGLQAAEKLDVACVRRLKDRPYSHDNVFHTTIGLLDVDTSAYDRALDIFRPCRLGEPSPRP